MPYQTFLVRKARHFVPSEASVSAAELQSIAREARGMAAGLRGIASKLDSSWEGRSSDRFLDPFQGQAPAAESSAAWFQAQGQHVGSITVTIWDTEPQTVWVPDS